MLPNVRTFRIALLALTLPTLAFAQAGATIKFGGLSQDPTLPVQVSAEKLTVNQSDQTAMFEGKVLVSQGQIRMSAPRVRVEYAKGGAASGHIARLLASGGVTLTSGDAAAEGQQAEYNVDKGHILLTGNVVMTQGQNAMSGQKLNIDLTTGVGVMEGRVQTVFRPAEKKK